MPCHVPMLTPPNRKTEMWSSNTGSFPGWKTPRLKKWWLKVRFNSHRFYQNKYIDKPINRHLLSNYCVYYARDDTKKNNTCSYVVPTQENRYSKNKPKTNKQTNKIKHKVSHSKGNDCGSDSVLGVQGKEKSILTRIHNSFLATWDLHWTLEEEWDCCRWIWRRKKRRVRKVLGINLHNYNLISVTTHNMVLGVEV